ncbi:hypothetical protein COCVIDRAFT_18313 [Bipolaris victoriae FI3]|uniref:Uncharacterized protein n=1 Tax=Bipolaris victoriae (strain FI3) TaxID=930091 RepID=W7EB50_BIPV3|nr:hypothetical protein COCVIDRAFT_18313 [Bipolaris victoriae FI3]
MSTAIEQLGAKIYLIHTPQLHRPFLTTVPFIAGDFVSWGYRVDQHASNSPYIAEIRAREKKQHANRKGRDVSQRTKLMEIWAHEIIERKKTEREARRQNSRRGEGETTTTTTDLETSSPCMHTDPRMKKTGDFVQDFLGGIVEVGNEDNQDIPPLKKTPEIQPETLRIRDHIRYLYAIRYVPNAPLPDWAHPTVTYADMVVLEYRPQKTDMHDQFLRALGKAIGKDEGRMGKVETCIKTGAMRVSLWMDVGDVIGEWAMSRQGDVEDRDPVPKYERGEGPPAYI